jgi:PPOX class probable F420-dependent enzyme
VLGGLVADVGEADVVGPAGIERGGERCQCLRAVVNVEMTAGGGSCASLGGQRYAHRLVSPRALAHCAVLTGRKEIADWPDRLRAPPCDSCAAIPMICARSFGFTIAVPSPSEIDVEPRRLVGGRRSVEKGRTMQLTAELAVDRRQRVESRLRTNIMAWLTTVSANGQPASVPVWFLLRDDETILLYSRPNKAKLRNIEVNPNVALGLDVTDLGRDVIRIDGTATRQPGAPRADHVPEYVAKYIERIAAIFGTAEQFADRFTEAVVITPTKLHA